MTMHLVNGMSTVNTNKPQPTKLTNAKRKEMGDALSEHNRALKQQGRHNERLTFDEYVDCLHGRLQHKRKPLTVKQHNPYRRTTSAIPSLNSGSDIAPKKDSQKYTGTLVTGISTLHKSNAVPVINNEQVLEIARMRR
jgi:hypothetical protein